MKRQVYQHLTIAVFFLCFVYPALLIASRTHNKAFHRRSAFFISVFLSSFITLASEERAYSIRLSNFWSNKTLKRNMSHLLGFQYQFDIDQKF